MNFEIVSIILNICLQLKASKQRLVNPQLVTGKFSKEFCHNLLIKYIYIYMYIHSAPYRFCSVKYALERNKIAFFDI